MHGQRVPIIGTVTMSFCMIDISHIPDAKIGDEVILFGGQLAVDELADICGTISYEIYAELMDIFREYIWAPLKAQSSDDGKA
ncbi:MAG: alanine racemase C-terminal domain-containing protein [Candidatus Desantisbacteria bacterium]